MLSQAKLKFHSEVTENSNSELKECKVGERKEGVKKRREEVTEEKERREAGGRRRQGNSIKREAKEKGSRGQS